MHTRVSLERPGAEDGKARLESAIAPFLDRLATSVLMIEGYSQLATTDQPFIQSRARAASRGST